MNKVLISLLKGTIRDKLSLLREELLTEELVSLCNSSLLKERYNLEKGINFTRFREIKKVIESRNIKTVSINDENYPNYLKEIYDPPFLVYVWGNADALNKDLVSIVGTRKPSVKGYHSAFKIGIDLGRCNVGVVSGLALGIDGASHTGNLYTGGKTVAVLGSGIDEIYPKAHKGLAAEIISNGGAVISEYPPGDSIRKYNFPKRNRIIAGLTRHLIIIQAPKKSGSLITGDFALQNGSEIYVHSAGIADKRFIGSDNYYKQGARKIDSSLPVLKAFGKSCNMHDFDLENYCTGDLVKMELEDKLVKYKGGYFLK